MQIGESVEAKGHAAEAMLRDWRGDTLWWMRHQAPRLLATLLAVIVLLALLRLITHRLLRFSERQPIKGLRSQQLHTLASIVGSVGKFVIFFLAALQALPLFGVDVKPILASAGIAGLAVGFGAQTLVKDVINGFFILVENQYDVGDTVKVAGVTGTVEDMSLRRTTLRDANGTVHVVPNSEIKVVSNLTRDWAQLTLHVSAGADENSDRIIKLLQGIAMDVYEDDRFRDSLVSQPEVPGIERVSGQEVDYLVLAKVRPGQQYAIGRELRKRVIDCFQKEKVRSGGPGRMYVLDSDPTGREE